MVIVSAPLGFADISYSFVSSITDADGNGDDFDSLTGIATDTEDRIIALDPGLNGHHDHRIQIFDSDGTFASSFLTGGNIGDDDLTIDVTTDSQDRIIVADSGLHAIKIFSSDGTLTSTITDADGIGGAFNTPSGIATDTDDRIIVADSFNMRIQIFDSNGGFDSSFGTSFFPSGVTTDSKNRIIVTDFFTSGVHIFDSDGNSVLQFGINGDGDGEFDNPFGVTTDSSDRIIVSDESNHRIQIFDSDGNYISQFGSLGDGDGEFKNQRYLTTDSQDRIIVADATNHRIQIFETPLVNTSSSSGCNSDCKPPSLESFEFNNTSNWLTAKNQTFNIGDKQEMKFVYHENEGIDDINDVEIGFGLPYLGSPMYNAEIKLKINTNQGNFTSLEIDDENKLFLENSTTVKIEQVQCGFNECLEYTLEFIWAEIPFDGYFLITASDDHNNTTYDRNEEPFTVIGETLNEEPTITLYNRYTSTMQDGLYIDITRTDKVTDMWIDDKGEYWCGLGNDQFELVH